MVDPVSLSFRSSPHTVAFFAGSGVDQKMVPPLDFIQSCPRPVREKFRKLLVEIAKAPTWKYSGGGYWEAMHGDLSGWFEVRVDGPNREHFRLFCRLDYFAVGVDRPLLVVIAGLRKNFGSTFKVSDYASVLTAGEQYLSANPRELA